MIFRHIAFFLAFALSFGAVPSVAEDLPLAYGFKAFGTDQGLVSPSITAIVQDSGGFLWVGTEDGLFRLEGERFRRFGTEDGLPVNHVESLAPARPAGIWVVTAKGIVLWDGLKFRRPSSFGLNGLDDRSGLPLPSGGVILSNFDAKQRFFSASNEGGFRELKDLPWGGGASSAYFDPDRNIFAIALLEGLWVWDGQSWKSRTIFPAATKNKAILSLFIDRKGRYWLRQTDRLFRLDSFDAPAVELAAPEPLSVVSNSFLAEDEFGRVWTNTAESLLWFSDSGSGVLGERQGLPHGAAFVFHFDRQGTLWVGGDGIFKLQGNFIWSWATRNQGIPGEVVWSIRRTRDGRVWAGTAAGLVYGTPTGWSVVPGTQPYQIMALFEDARGVLWVGHTFEPGTVSGLMRILPGKTEARTVDVPGISGSSSINSIAQGPGESLWLGTSDSGLVRVFPQSAGLDAEAVNIPGWPADSQITKITSDGAGGLWVVGVPGAAHWNGTAWAVLPEKSLPDQDLLSVVPFELGSAWVSPTNSKQLALIVREGDSLRFAQELPSDHPLSQALIFGLEKDSRGVIWVATARGVMRWGSGRVEKYGRNAGLPGEDCAQNALWVDPDGDVWAGLSVGIAYGDMEFRKASQLPPGITILESRAGSDRMLSPGGPPARIPWKSRTLFFRYAPRGSRWTEGIAYQVRLVGLEDSWRDTDILEARYPGLASGHYRFEVRTVSATREFGQPKSLDFQILAPWWRRWWAQVIWGILLLAAAFQFVRWRTSLLHRRNEFLEALVEARTSDLEKANEALREAVLIDPLTGLNNRRFLTMTMPEEEERLRRVFRSYLQKGQSPLNRNEDLVLFLGDLDFFKAVNDTYGHTTGDQMIQETAQVLRSVCRTADTLVRWGGEEFLLVAKRTDRENAHSIADKLCLAVREHPYALPNGQVLHCSISIGFSAFPILVRQPESFNWEDALQVADQCLYAAKSAGRDGWVGMHTQGLQESAELSRRLRTDLRGLVREGQVQVRGSFPLNTIFA